MPKARTRSTIGKKIWEPIVARNFVLAMTSVSVRPSVRMQHHRTTDRMAQQPEKQKDRARENY